MSESKFVALKINNAVARLTVDRPEALNALNAAVLEQLSEGLDHIAQLPYTEVRAVVIEGAGEKAFVAGADIKLMQTASRGDLRWFISLGQSVMRQIETLALPVVAAVDGFAIGGGLELALACDIIVASNRSKMGQAEVNLGLIPGFGGTQRLVNRIGVGATKRLVFSGDNISAEEALRLGVVDYCVAPEEFSGTVERIVQGWLTKSPFAIAAAKRAVEVATATSRLAGLTQEVEQFISLFDYEDTKEGLAAFVEKRKPLFKGER